MSSSVLSAINFKKLSQYDYSQELNNNSSSSNSNSNTNSLDSQHQQNQNGVDMPIESDVNIDIPAVDSGLKSKLNNSLKTLNMLNILRKNRQLCDVILQIDDKHNDIYCHQVILACNSKLFMELLLDNEISTTTDNENLGIHHNGHSLTSTGTGTVTGTTTATTNGNGNHSPVTTDSEFVTYNSSNRKVVIKLENYLKQLDYKLSEHTYDALKTCINYMYKFDLNLNLNNMNLIKEIYCLSIQLSINSLTTRCSKFLIDNLNDTNCLYIRTFALDTLLITSSTEYIQQYMSKLIYLNEFQQLPRLNIELVGCASDSTEYLNDLLIKWLVKVFYNNEEKQTVLNDLCENINILYLNDDKSLHDCCDMNSNNQNYCEYIVDYQKKALHHHNQQSQTTTEILVGDQIQELFNGIISTIQTSENNFVVLCIINGSLLTLSVQVKMNTQKNDDELSSVVAAVEKRLNSIDATSNQNQLSVNEAARSKAVTPDIEFNNGDENFRSFDYQRSISVASQGSNGNSKLPKMNSARCSHGLVTINKKLYIIGGYDRGECLTTCEVYDPIENKLSVFEELRNRRGRSSTVYVPKLKSIFVFGGSDGHKDLNSLEKYDFNSNKWSLVPFDVNFDCTNIGITIDDDFVYLVGIHDNKTNMPIHCLKYDPSSNKFSFMADLNSGRSQCALTRHKEFLYVFGGHDKIRCLNTCEVYNIKENTWNYLSPMIEPRRGCGAAENNGLIYIVGGTNGSSSLKSTEIYNIQTNKFTIGPELNLSRANVSISFIGDYLFAVGGFDGKNFLKTIECLNINDLNSGWFIYHQKIDSNFI